MIWSLSNRGAFVIKNNPLADTTQITTKYSCVN